jgi:hypothetical protein
MKFKELMEIVGDEPVFGAEPLVGEQGIPFGEFLLIPVEEWFK